MNKDDQTGAPVDPNEDNHEDGTPITASDIAAAAVSRLVMEWNPGGKGARHHDRMRGRIRRENPMIALALDHLLEATVRASEEAAAAGTLGKA